jgi:putative ABC transport system ATP-binding protein
LTERGGIRLRGVAKHYSAAAGVVRAVDGIDLDVDAGSSIAIMGPSGCGKSTLLALIGGLEAPTRGSVELGDVEISRLHDGARARVRREQIGFLFQSDDLLPYLTAVENVAVQLALRGEDDGEGRSQRLLAQVGLSEHEDKLPDQLSGGQRQRVGIARALVHRPRVLLADEPTGELDGATSDAVIDLLLAVQRETKLTLVVVTHDAHLASRMDRTLRLRDGRLAEPDAPASPGARRRRPSRPLARRAGRSRRPSGGERTEHA